MTEPLLNILEKVAPLIRQSHCMVRITVLSIKLKILLSKQSSICLPSRSEPFRLLLTPRLIFGQTTHFTHPLITLPDEDRICYLSSFVLVQTVGLFIKGPS